MPRNLIFENFEKSSEMAKQITPNEYFQFWKKSCIRDDFTPQYFTLGLVEEISEVLEETTKKPVDSSRVVKEIGDVLWYTVGLIQVNGWDMKDIIGEDWKVQSTSSVDCSDIVIVGGAIAGRLKKFERGDFPLTKLREYLKPLLLKVLSHLKNIATNIGCSSLESAAYYNREKISRRLAANTLKGDGSDR